MRIVVKVAGRAKELWGKNYNIQFGSVSYAGLVCNQSLGVNSKAFVRASTTSVHINAAPWGREGRRLVPQLPTHWVT